MVSDEQIVKLSDLLFQADPAGTACVENEAEDEYDMIAHQILKSDDVNVETFNRVFSESFGDEYDSSNFQSILESYQSQV